MSDLLKITSWTNRMNGGVDDPQKFARVLNDLQDVALHDAVTSLGFDDDTYLCVKEISVPVKLDMSRSIRSLSRQWSGAFKKQLSDKLQLADSSVVLFKSLRLAHISCAKGILSNNTSELWAWQQAGVFSNKTSGYLTPQSLIEQWSAASLERGYHQIALWRYLLLSPLLLTAKERLSEPQWRQHLAGLADALVVTPEPILNFVKRHFRVANSLESVAEDNRRPHTQEAMPAEGKRLPQQMNSPFFISAIKSLKVEPARLLMCMAIITSEPALLTLPKVDRERRLAEILARIEARISLRPKRGAHSKELLDSIGLQRSDLSVDSQCDSAFSNARTGDQAKPSKISAIDYTQAPLDTPKQDVTQQTDRIVTQFAGLFWSYNVLIANPEVVQSLLKDTVFEQHDHAWIWCWLACYLLTESPAEAAYNASFKTAVMAFAGIVDHDQFDALITQAPDDQQKAVLNMFSGDIKTIFLDKIQVDSSESKPSFSVFLRRPGVIKYDGTWLQIEFSLNDVDINVRRAGLDADPGFIAWLGMVVRFSYA